MSKDQTYITQLDGLRFFAVTAVMFAHWIQWKLTNHFIERIPFSHGVVLFFVLSGFLITRILLVNKETYDVNRRNKTWLIQAFYIRRALRIFPIYYAVLFALLLINYPLSRELFPWLATFTINIYQSIKNISVGDFNHFWSLAVEEQFYLFWPWIILFTPRKHFLKLISTLLIVSITYKAYIYFFVHKWMASSYFVLGCADSLGIGALVAYLFLYHQALSIKLASVFVLWPAIFFYAFTRLAYAYIRLDGIESILDEFLFAMVAACIINRAAHNKFSHIAKYILKNRFVIYCGKISYGMYLYHLFIPFVYFYVKSKIGFHVDNLLVYFLALYTSTFALAHFSWVLFEKPINDLKKKFPYFKKE